MRVAGPVVARVALIVDRLCTSITLSERTTAATRHRLARLLDIPESHGDPFCRCR
jgi:hypothetical protein